MGIALKSRKLIASAARGAGLAVVAGLVALLMASGMLSTLNDGFAAMRYALLDHPASDHVTVVEIDAASLRAAGHWPWGRERFAQAIENLEAAGAETVAFDVDFSARSSPEGDRRLQAAIEAKPGAVVLPTFVHTGRSGGGEQDETTPMGALSGQALLASVNVPLDKDGRVRRYLHGSTAGDAYRPSMASVLASGAHGKTGAFIIDFGFKARDVGRVSFDDVLNNRFDPALVRGRSVLIGATALELGDEFATPAGTLSGVYVHALAAISLWTGRALAAPSPLVSFALAVLLAFCLRPTRSTSTLKSLSRRHLMAAGGLLIIPVALQAAAPVSIEVGPFLVAQALCLAWGVRAELKQRAQAIVRAREDGLLHLAMHEPETALPNRRALLAAVCEGLGTPDTAMAVVAIGLDRYATLRGAVGYSSFNQLVCAVATRLTGVCRDSHVAHLSTSVLGLMIRRADLDSLRLEIETLERLDPGYQIEGYSVDAFIRLGVAYAGAGETSAEALLEHATIALDQARAKDRRAVVFNAESYADPSLNLALMSEMRSGLEAGDLSLHYQPKVSAKDGTVDGVEALVRWVHPVHGRIPPDSFINTAEETGSIREFTEWTIGQALKDSAKLRAAGHRVRVSVNISGRLIADEAFRDHVLAAVSGRCEELCLEVTETAVIENPAAATAAIAAFRDAGLAISIDDYGVGLSSLSYLKLLNADELKVDKSLVVSVAEDLRDRLIMKSTIDLAHSLGMKVVAEGVETDDVRAALALLGCDAIQGYLISRPVPLDDLLPWLDSLREDKKSRSAA